MPKLLRAMLSAVLLALSPAVTTPLAAQEPERLDLEEGVEWKHPHSGIIVPAELGGIKRRFGTAFAPDSLNVGFSFDVLRGREPVESLSVYIYRRTSGDVPVWLAQAQAAIALRDIYASAEAVGGTRSFVPPGQEQASGLKAIYRLGPEAPMQSTGVALFPVGSWLVKVRASSVSRTSDELDMWMDEAIAQLVLPSVASVAALPVQDCATPLVLGEPSQDAPEDLGASILGSLLGGSLDALRQEEEEEAPSEDEAPRDPVQWCAESDLGQAQIVYRADERTDGYLIALGDSGMGVQVYRDTLSELLVKDGVEPAPRFNIVLQTEMRSTNFVAQDRLPSPRRVVEIINGNRVVSRTTTWGDERPVEIIAPD